MSITKYRLSPRSSPTCNGSQEHGTPTLRPAETSRGLVCRTTTTSVRTDAADRARRDASHAATDGGKLAGAIVGDRAIGFGL